jgi:hypothetical protein
VPRARSGAGPAVARAGKRQARSDRQQMPTLTAREERQGQQCRHDTCISSGSLLGTTDYKWILSCISSHTRPCRPRRVGLAPPPHLQPDGEHGSHYSRPSQVPMDCHWPTCQATYPRTARVPTVDGRTVQRCRSVSKVKTQTSAAACGNTTNTGLNAP